jgi:hypothetical protein
MPLARIHDFSKQQVKELASQQGLSTDGTLEAYLPSQSTAAKSSEAMKSDSQITESLFYDSYYLNKMEIKW